MGSQSDWATMSHCAKLLEQFQIPYEAQVVSAHRTPVWMAEYAQTADTRGLKLIIAAAGGAAHLHGMVAAHTHLPVLGVPIQGRTLMGIDSLLSIVQMPAGVPVATLAVGEAGAKNAAILALSILGTADPSWHTTLKHYREAQTAQVMNHRDLVLSAESATP
ncbi:MAG: 5-(carboxyamino)imidazole ribonucleotide mutase [Vampirovibrionales bacterium]